MVRTSRASVILARTPPASTLFPYTTLFRSRPARGPHRAAGGAAAAGAGGGRPGRDAARAAALVREPPARRRRRPARDRKSTRLNSSHPSISYAVFCLKKKNGDGLRAVSSTP